MTLPGDEAMRQYMRDQRMKTMAITNTTISVVRPTGMVRSLPT